MRVVIAAILSSLLFTSLSAQTWTWSTTTGAHPVVSDMRNGSVLAYAAPKENELSEWQALPFPFTFAGETVTGYFISDNGYITFDANATASVPDAASGTVTNAIFGYWNDFHLEGGNPVWSNEVRTKTDGIAPERVHVIMWISAVPKGQTFSRSNVSFAIVLYERGGFEIVFVAGRTDGTLAGTVGAVSADGTVSVLLPGSPRFPYPNVTSDPSDDIRYMFEWSNVGTDGALAASLTSPVVRVGEPVAIRGTVRNLGITELTAFSIHYSVDDAPEQEMQVHGVTLPSNGSWDFTHDVAWTPAEAGRLYTVTMRLQLDGDLIDENPDNDTLSSTVFTILGISSEKRVLVEEFTGAWCGWCPDGAVQIEKLARTHPLAIPVAIHAGGTDAMITPEGSEIARVYNPSYPTAMIDRVHFDGEPSVPIHRTRDAWISRTGEQFTAYSPLAVAVSGAYEPASSSGFVDVNVTFSDFAPPADYRLHCWLVFDAMTGVGRGWDQANYYSGNQTYPDHPFFSLPNPVPDYEHRHVLYRVLSGYWGMEQVIPSSPHAGETYSRRFALGPLASRYHAGMRIVAFVTRHSEDVLDRPVLNASIAELRVNSVDAAVPTGLLLADVHPQPATGMVHALLTLPRTTAVRVAVYDVMGRERLIVRDSRLGPGSHALSFSTTGLDNGLYLLRVQTDGQANTIPFIVLH
jgi:hypothetical protein